MQMSYYRQQHGMKNMIYLLLICIHSYIRLTAVDPLWESKSDWDIYKTLAKSVSDLAKTHMKGTFKDVVTTPLAHDSKQEISTPYGIVKDWSKGEIEAIPGKTMPGFAVVERDYTVIYDKYISVGPLLEKVKSVLMV